MEKKNYDMQNIIIEENAKAYPFYRQTLDSIVVEILTLLINQNKL